MTQNQLEFPFSDKVAPTKRRRNDFIAKAAPELSDIVQKPPRVPRLKKKPVRKTLKRLVMKILKEFYDAGKIQELDFEAIRYRVVRNFPQSKFEPKHLAWYKHHFLTSEVI